MNNLETLAGREDHANTRAELKGDIAKTREDLKGDATKIKEDLMKMGSRLEIKLIEFKSDIINWMLALFMIIMMGIMLVYFKH